jgi:hypothetical protein
MSFALLSSIIVSTDGCDSGVCVFQKAACFCLSTASAWQAIWIAFGQVAWLMRWQSGVCFSWQGPGAVQLE